MSTYSDCSIIKLFYIYVSSLVAVVSDFGKIAVFGLTLENECLFLFIQNLHLSLTSEYAFSVVFFTPVIYPDLLLFE